MRFCIHLAALSFMSVAQVGGVFSFVYGSSQKLPFELEQRLRKLEGNPGSLDSVSVRVEILRNRLDLSLSMAEVQRLLQTGVNGNQAEFYQRITRDVDGMIKNASRLEEVYRLFNDINETTFWLNIKEQLTSLRKSVFSYIKN